jgi:hypothetical protein
LLSDEARRKWSSLNDWFALTCSHPDTLRGLTLSELTLDQVGCKESEYRHEYEYAKKHDVKFRAIQRNKRNKKVARLIWSVVSEEEDIAGFKLNISRESSPNGASPLAPLILDLSYNERSHLVKDLNEDVSYHLCLSYVDSLGREMKSQTSGHCIRSSDRKFITYPRSWTSSTISVHSPAFSLLSLVLLFVALLTNQFPMSSLLVQLKIVI